ncbi:MAG: SH3 domain-containing protein [Sphingobacterium sp.]|uniref:SH3 domain-containing protein n=1 Tax=Sphingobacterium sp. JB170 TaxID=1434842 RepID=UPI00097E8B98|nr:SH3 domain-containing protein [Sphingobacterium sp. JB170]SJN39099.1 Peptidoglycan-binding LysM [Sphingobacterium sp. JB170]
MGLLDKYKILLDTAKSADILDLQVAEQEGVLQIRGTAPNADVKNKLWDIYNQIDPNFLSGDVVMNVDVSSAIVGSEVRVITESTNLNIRKGPGTDQPIVGKAAKDEVITLISRANDQWWLVRTRDGEEGYCYAQYLEPIG